MKYSKAKHITKKMLIWGKHCGPSHVMTSPWISLQATEFGSVHYSNATAWGDWWAQRELFFSPLLKIADTYKIKNKEYERKSKQSLYFPDC